MVSVSIISIITMLAFINYPSFSKKITIERAARELVLNLRKAQTYALGVKETNNAFPAYATQFNENESFYTLFAGVNNNYEQIDQIFFPGTAKISEVCIYTPLENCGPSSLLIAFSRPDPSTSFLPTGSGAKIVICLSNCDFKKTIYVYQTGSIYVE